MTYAYKTKGTCSTLIELELDGNIVHNVKFTGGCNGNLQAIPKLVEGLTVEQVEQKIGGISCNGRGTSCGDQLAKACSFHDYRKTDYRRNKTGYFTSQRAFFPLGKDDSAL